MYHAFSRDKRRYFVTHSNCCPEGMERYIPLPIELSADKTGEITLNHGLLDTDGETVLYVGADKADAVPDVTFNGVALQCLGESDGSYFGADNKPYPIFAYKVPADALNGKAQMKFKCSTENVLRYVELMNANA